MLLGGLAALMGLLPAGAQTGSGPAAAQEALRTRVWPRRVSLRVHAATCDVLAFQLSQQLMTRVKVEPDIASQSLSLFAPECTLAELRDGLATMFGYRLEPYDSAESVHFQLIAGPASKVARSSKLVARRPAKAGASHPTKQPAPVSTTSYELRASSSPKSADATLQQKLDLSAVAVDDEAEALPTILECLSDEASILVLSDGGPRAGGRPGGRTTSQFVASLNGLTLGEALDRTARAFHASWSRSGRWFLFRSR
jgi:hypothetical protein